ncbi:GLYCINE DECARBOXYLASE COMPLEX H [Klebsormidium nitens]|uniref:Glycine cleavage system H protein n=1 Tax=Klebsormidium nitens TaxID=105231 RepID=A0A1Y1HQE8_KLENI|nr:GLYCINE DECARBOXYLASE COMPLEX H [Klebsormidium nitens]|eukprot:GAQ80855.1 GLYCINE DECARBOXYLASE COMPLEX H [Klebsormidium nitens]
MALKMVATELVGALRMRCQPGAASSLLFFLRPFSTAPQGTKYLTSHEWVNVQDGVGTVGISDFAQNELGDVVFVELPEVGATVTKGETFGVVESVKAASDVYSPVTGEVVERNDSLTETPALVNKGPFDDGWMLKVKLSNPSDVEDLLDASAYEKHCEDSTH